MAKHQTINIEEASIDDRQTIDISLDAEVVRFFQATGQGWQRQMNVALRQFMKRMH